MRKILKAVVILSSMILISCSKEKDIPKEYLGTYIQDAEYETYSGKEGRTGYANLFKKGNKYFLEIKSEIFENESIEERKFFKFEGRVKEIEYNETLPNKLRYQKDFYKIIFEDIKVSGENKELLKYNPVIWITGEALLKSKEEDYLIYSTYVHAMKPEKNPVSLIQIDGMIFKKLKANS